MTVSRRPPVACAIGAVPYRIAYNWLRPHGSNLEGIKIMSHPAVICRNIPCFKKRLHFCWLVGVSGSPKHDRGIWADLHLDDSLLTYPQPRSHWSVIKAAQSEPVWFSPYVTWAHWSQPNLVHDQGMCSQAIACQPTSRVQIQLYCTAQLRHSAWPDTQIPQVLSGQSAPAIWLRRHHTNFQSGFLFQLECQQTTTLVIRTSRSMYCNSSYIGRRVSSRQSKTRRANWSLTKMHVPTVVVIELMADFIKVILWTMLWEKITSRPESPVPRHMIWQSCWISQGAAAKTRSAPFW